MSRGVRVFPVGRRGARLIRKATCGPLPRSLNLPFKVADPRLCSRYGRPGRRPPAQLLLEIDVGERLPRWRRGR